MFEPGPLSRFWTGMSAPLMSFLSTMVAFLLTIAARAGAFLAETIADAEDKSQAGFQRLAQVAIKDMFGVDVSGSLNAQRGSGGNTAAADAIGGALLKAFAGQARGADSAGKIVPSDAPAKAFLSAMAQMALEGWLEGWLVEAMSLGQLETFGDLDDTISHVLGLGRASAAVHGPLVRHLIVTPLEWKINKEHRPNLLSESMATLAFIRGTMSLEEMREELARQGWSDPRISEFLASAYKRLSLAETLSLVRHGSLGRTYAIENLQQQGYGKITAELAITAAEQQRLDSIADNALPALLRAFVDRDISDSVFSSLLGPIIADDVERVLYEETARIQRQLNVRHMSHADVVEAVKLGVLPRAFYREWLTREGYPPDEALALELLLAQQLVAEHERDENRRRIEKEHADEKKARDDAAKKRLADVEAQRKLDRRGSIADLRRAAARGLIPFARVEAVLAAQYDPDFVAIVSALVEQDRLDYLDQQAARAEAAKRALVKRIDVGALEQAVLNDVLTIDEFRGAVLQRGIDEGDVDILTATLAARYDDLQVAKQKRRDADAAAHKRSINLSVIETLVRRGHRSLADYNALLDALGFDDADRAAMIDLLQLQIADDAAARAAREAADAKGQPKDVSVADFRRGVILGLRSEDEFGAFLLENKFTADAIALLVAELRHDVQEAEAARLKREAAAAGPGPPTLPLSTVARAARLGVVSPAVYQQRLVDAGFSDDDVSIEMDLLINEIADVQAARAKQAAADAAAPTAGLALAQIAAAVKVGVRHLEDYRAAAIAKGLSVADVTTLQRVLADELVSTQAAATRRAAIQSELKPADVNLADFTDQVKRGDATVADYHAALVQLGLHPVDVALLTALLVDELAGRTGGA